MFEDFDIDWNVAGIAILFYLLFMMIILFVPGWFNLKEYPLLTKIISAIALLPISYIIVNKMANG